MILNSPSIKHEGEIPSQYTCDGGDTTPPFKFIYVPQDAVSLVFLVEDYDAPNGIFVHWMLWNIDPKVEEIMEGKTPTCVVGKNSGLTNEWYSICPPDGEHKYHFKLYALDTKLDLDPETTTREELLQAMEGHIIANEEIVGIYTKKENRVAME